MCVCVCGLRACVLMSPYMYTCVCGFGSQHNCQKVGTKKDTPSTSMCIDLWVVSVGRSLATELNRVHDHGNPTHDLFPMQNFDDK